MTHNVFLSIRSSRVEYTGIRVRSAALCVCECSLLNEQLPIMMNIFIQFRSIKIETQKITVRLIFSALLMIKNAFHTETNFSATLNSQSSEIVLAVEQK